MGSFRHPSVLFCRICCAISVGAVSVVCAVSVGRNSSVRHLECDSNDLTVNIERRPARVARVDGGVDLHREQVGARVGVPLDLDARDDALRDRDALPTLGVADHRHLVLERRHAAEGKGRDALPEGLVCHPERRQVALVR
eukprot:scaffold8831_cov135-Isochrysis_galbana.AAC.5